SLISFQEQSTANTPRKLFSATMMMDRPSSARWKLMPRRSIQASRISYCHWGAPSVSRLKLPNSHSSMDRISMSSVAISAIHRVVPRSPSVRVVCQHTRPAMNGISNRMTSIMLLAIPILLYQHQGQQQQRAAGNQTDCVPAQVAVFGYHQPFVGGQGNARNGVDAG